MIVNNSNVSMLDSIIRIDNNIYLPISDMAIVYNINMNYIKDTNRVVIDELNTGMIRATAIKDTKIKFKPRGLSKSIGKLKKGENVSCFYTTSKGWRQIRKEDGTIGYLKANKLSDEYILRQDMQENEEAKTILKSNYENKFFEISDVLGTKKVTLKSIFNISNQDIQIFNQTNNENTNSKIWAVITNDLLKNQTNEILKDYKLRTNLIDIIVRKSIENNINGISIEFNEIEEKQNMRRFIIELAPKLREVGIDTCIVLNGNIDKEDIINVVDYIVE